MLNQEQINGKWKEIKGGLRNLWGELREDELDKFKGNVTEVAGLVEQRYGETKEEIKKKLKSLMDSFDNDTDKNLSPDVSSFERAPETAEESQRMDSDINTRSPERSQFDKKTYSESQRGLNDPEDHSNYSGANPNREKLNSTNHIQSFDADKNARH